MTQNYDFIYKRHKIPILKGKCCRSWSPIAEERREEFTKQYPNWSLPDDFYLVCLKGLNRSRTVSWAEECHSSFCIERDQKILSPVWDSEETIFGSSIKDPKSFSQSTVKHSGVMQVKPNTFRSELDWQQMKNQVWSSSVLLPLVLITPGKGCFISNCPMDPNMFKSKGIKLLGSKKCLTKSAKSCKRGGFWLGFS